MSMYDACWNSWRNFKSKIKTIGHGRASEAATCECEASTSVTGRSDEDSRSIEDEHEDQPEFGIRLMRWGLSNDGTEAKRSDFFLLQKYLGTYEAFFFDQSIIMQANHIWIAIIFRIGSCHGEGQEGPRGHGAHELPIPGLQSHDEVRVQKQL